MPHSFHDSDSPGRNNAWNYDEAFCRQRGLVDSSEQNLLRNSRIALAGLGGVGGIHLVTLARLGIGSFHIADPDHFELANFNRQHGATMLSLGCSKVKVMAADARAINPDLDLKVFNEPITAVNIDAFLDGVDVVVDGLDFFALDARRLLFHEARRRGLWALTAGPIGFSTAWLVFAPDGMSFDQYFGFTDAMDPIDQIVAFATGLTPRALQRTYMDLSQTDLQNGRGPSSALACQLCAGVAAAEVAKILLKRGPVHCAPQSFQFDAYRQRFVTTRLWRGNGTPWRRWLRRRFRKMLEHRLSQNRLPNKASSPLEELVRAAVLAPSGDNTQPWRFQVDEQGSKILIASDQSRDPSPMNAGGRMARIAVGAALENMFQTAESRGWCLKLGKSSRPEAVVLELQADSTSRASVAQVIQTRVTNRRFYDGRPVASKMLHDLEVQTPSFEGVMTHWICSRDRLAALAALIGRADEMMFGEPSMRQAFLSNVRFDARRDAQVEEGLSVGSLEMSLGERLAMGLMQYVPNRLLHGCGAMGAFGARAEKLVQSASGLCLVVAADRRKETDMAVGRVAQRAWFALTSKGLAVQPMMSLLVLDNLAESGAQDVLDSLGRDRLSVLLKGFRNLAPECGQGRPAFLLRFGFALPPQSRTGRLPFNGVAVTAAHTTRQQR